jgi:hypothetical protein
MITFVLTRDHQYTVREALERQRHELHGKVIILSYGNFLAMRQLPVSSYVFLDLERLDDDVRLAAQRRLEALYEAGAARKVLNPPGRYPGRLGVMRVLSDKGFNDFRVMPANERAPDLRFPVFLRRLDNHEGPMTNLIHTDADLDAALRSASEAGVPASRLAVTEYVDARDADGYHEVRAQFRVGAAFFPAGYDVSTHWVNKGLPGDPNLVQAAEKQEAFLHDREHDPMLRAAFEAVDIDYGRADYALVNGKPQIFEINTNPMVETPRVVKPWNREMAQHLLNAWLTAVAALSPEADPAPTWVPVGARLSGNGQNGLSALASGRRLLQATLHATNTLHRETAMMQVLWRPVEPARNLLKGAIGRN